MSSKQIASGALSAEHTRGLSKASEAGHSTVDSKWMDSKLEYQVELLALEPIRPQYFCSRGEFENRLTTLVRLASQTRVRLIYGTISIDEQFLEGENLAKDHLEETMVEFENAFINYIRVPRKYVPPAKNISRKRKSDATGYTGLSGNFDMARGTPSTTNKPRMIEFIMYDCDPATARKKAKALKNLAQPLCFTLLVPYAYRLFAPFLVNTWPDALGDVLAWHKNHGGHHPYHRPQ